MPTERLSMRRIRQVLQLHFGARASARMIAGTVGVGRSTVQDYLARAAAAGLAWPLPPELTDDALEQLLFPAPSNRPGARRYSRARLVGAGARDEAPRGQSVGIVRGISGRLIPTATLIAAFVSFTGRLSGVCRRRCARRMWPAIRRSSTIPASRCRSSTR